MSSNWFMGAVDSVWMWLKGAWGTIVMEEQQHPVILIMAIIFLTVIVLSFICNCCVWCCGLCKRKAAYQNVNIHPSAPSYGTMEPSTSKKVRTI